MDLLQAGVIVNLEQSEKIMASGDAGSYDKLEEMTTTGKARIFLLVDLREFFFRFRVEGTKKKKKALKMTS